MLRKEGLRKKKKRNPYWNTFTEEAARLGLRGEKCSCRNVKINKVMDGGEELSNKPETWGGGGRG